MTGLLHIQDFCRLATLSAGKLITLEKILDPFAGCGTAVHAAQRLKRSWIGIDITHLAIAVIERRLREAFTGIQYKVHGTPRDLEGAWTLAARDKYQFQLWACALVGAHT
jgi:adenine specific DNA methylase Mod